MKNEPSVDLIDGSFIVFLLMAFTILSKSVWTDTHE